VSRLISARAPRHSWAAPLVAIALTFASAAGLSWAVYRTVWDQAEASHALVRLSLLSGEIARLDEALTASARLSAASGDLTWEARYNADVPRLDTAIHEAMALADSPQAKAALARTATSNLRLIDLETAGFEAARAGRLDQARALVLGKRYQALKTDYSAGLAEALQVARAAADRNTRAAERRLQVLLFVGAGALLAIAALWLVILHAETRRVEALKAWRDLRDLDRRKTEEGRELAAARDAAESANRAKSEFLANMSHELRTPLNGVLGVAGALSRTALTPTQREMADLITDSAKTLEAILSDILDLSKIEAGRLSIEEAPFDLAAEVGSICDLMRTRAEERGLAFELRLDPATAGGFVGDALRLKQVIANLLSNALKFTAKGSVRLAVEVTEAAAGEPQVRFSVSDTGIGFDEAAAGRLFDRFAQADGSITRRFGGTGLGLAITQSLVEMMGGTITATSRPGFGSTFTVEVPLCRGCAPRQAAAPATPMGDQRGLRILLAEDHVVNQRVVDLILQPHGVDLTIVDDGAQAVAAVESASFDLILMDMQMPVMDGLTAVAAIRRLEQDRGAKRTPIAMLSANAMDEHRKASLACGADVHIAKPFSPETLIAQIQDLLDGAAGGDAEALDAVA